MSNYLKNESSPYLLQHAENPVAWYPWCEEAFDRAAKEEKPIFLSIGYSTCHWCHVMAHESFENQETADILNRHFISIKVDREERPDIDSVYMTVCQAFTGSGGWPMSIFMTPEQKPFFAGTYFPPETRQGMIGFPQLLMTVVERWKNNRESLLSTADEICAALNRTESGGQEGYQSELVERAVQEFIGSFDAEYGGFGSAPKFPTPHNLLFLILYWDIKKYQNKEEEYKNILAIAEKTLDAMRRGGIFDQIGYGFSRYSTDRFYLAPHFEKMLYDNALLIMAYAAAGRVTGREIYLDTAEKTAHYLLEEMMGENGEFYSAQDADSEGEEGRFYLWDYEEICSVLGKEEGKAFCDYYGISRQGNFMGKNIPNLLNGNDYTDTFDQALHSLYLYRKNRGKLHRDDKVLTSWNALAICAFSMLYQASGKREYLMAAEKTAVFIEKNMAEGNLLYACLQSQKQTIRGFLEDYAYYLAALLSLYDAAGKEKYLERATDICREIQLQFFDTEHGGYFLYGERNSSLIAKPKETYDGAMPSGNSVMAYCLVRLARITGKEKYIELARQQLEWMCGKSQDYPAGHSMFLIAMLLQEAPEEKVTIVLGNGDGVKQVYHKFPLFSRIQVLQQETSEYHRLEEKTTYYICKNHTCLPPVTS